MGDEFHAVLKLVTGEEIFALVSVDENDGDPVIMLSNPVIMKMLHSPAGQYVKVRPWLELPTEDLFLMKYEDIREEIPKKQQLMMQAKQELLQHLPSAKDLVYIEYIDQGSH